MRHKVEGMDRSLLLGVMQRQWSELLLELGGLTLRPYLPCSVLCWLQVCSLCFA